MHPATLIQALAVRSLPRMRLDPNPPSVPSTRPISPTATARPPLLVAMGGLSLSEGRSPASGGVPPTPAWHTRPLPRTSHGSPAGILARIREEVSERYIADHPLLMTAKATINPAQLADTPLLADSARSDPGSPVMSRCLLPGPRQNAAQIFYGGGTAHFSGGRTSPPPAEWQPEEECDPFRRSPSPDEREYADKGVMVPETREAGVQAKPRVAFRTLATVKQSGGTRGDTISHTPITGSPAVGTSPILPLSPPVTSSDIALAVSTPAIGHPREAASPSAEFCNCRSPDVHTPRPLRPGTVFPATPGAIPARTAADNVSHPVSDASPSRVTSSPLVKSPARIVAPTPAQRAPIERVLSPDSFVEIPNCSDRRSIDVNQLSDQEQYWDHVADPFANEDAGEYTDASVGWSPAPARAPPTSRAATGTRLPPPSSPATTASADASTSAEREEGGRGYHYSFYGGEFSYF